MTSKNDLGPYELEVGLSGDEREVIVNHPEMTPSPGGRGGHIVFSPRQARAFAALMIEKANACVGQSGVETAAPLAPGEGGIHESTQREQQGLMHPIETVWFRAGLLACRAYMAAFVEQGGNKDVADSIRANWWPSLGADPGAPRQNTFQELTEGEYGEPGFRVKKRDEVSPSVEALPVALTFLQGHCGWPHVHHSSEKTTTEPGT